MRRRLIASYLALAVVVLIVLEVPLGILGVRRERDQLSAQAQRDGTALAVVAQASFEHPGREDLATLIGHFGGETGAEVTVIDANGQTVARVDPKEAAEPGDSIPALARQALAGKTATRSARDEGQPVLAAAVPVRVDSGAVVGAVVVSVPAAAALDRIHWLIGGLGVLAAAVLGLTVLVGLVLARSVAEPLGDLSAAAKRLGEGQLSARARASGPSEVRALAASFNEMAATLEELVAAQRHFVADASHQLRSPLTALRLRLENLQVDANPAAATDLEAANKEVLRLSRLVDGLLALARAEGTRPERQVVDVAQIVEDRREAWSALAEERQVHLTVNGTSNNIERVDSLARAVPDHLEQILDNLLANALDATPPGRAINLRVQRDQAHLAVHVEDQGPGMTAAERTRAFDRFWQGPARPNGSSGLGLAIVQQLAHLDGAEVVLNRADGGGLDAAVILELAEPAHP